jgi:hypothetical protein
MPSIRVKCPLCPEMCSENGLGKHLASKAHADILRKNNEPLKAFLQVLKDGGFHKYMNRPPLFDVTKTESFYICMTCKKCYKNGEQCTRSAKHYEKSPACRKERVQELESFLFPKVKANDTNANDKITTLENTIEKTRMHWMNQVDLVDMKVERLKKLLSSMCGNEFDADDDDHLKKLEDFLDGNNEHKGYYCGIKFEEDDDN